MEPLDLRSISLVAVDTSRPERTLRALCHCLDQVRFRDTYLFTSERIACLPEEIARIPIPLLPSLEAYSEFMLWDFPVYRPLLAEHILIVQHDGFIRNPAGWRDEYLRYDYIGAPWGDGPGAIVGNGGFSLRSRRLLTALAELRPELTDIHPEDVAICRTYRSRLEARGIQFAPAEVARRFSVENTPYTGSFGYHGWRTEQMGSFSIDTLRPASPTPASQRPQTDPSSGTEKAVPMRRPRVVDCFLFFNELELLEIRLQELADVVDTFVLVEAAHTFTGKPKPLHFAENRARFEAFPIVPVTIPTFPENLASAWDREAYSRNALRDGLAGLDLASGDLILLSDVDEIPRADCIDRIAQDMAASHSVSLPAVLIQDFFYYYVDCQASESWKGTRLIRYGNLTTFASLRRVDGPAVARGGWHFSYLGGVDRIRDKIAAFSHTELDRPEFTGEAHLSGCLEAGRDIYGRSLRFTFRSKAESAAPDNPADLPAFLRDHRERFAALFHENG